MTPYNESDLANLELKQFAAKALKSNLVTEEEFKKIIIEHPVQLYIPNTFLRIGLGLLTQVIFGAFFGLIMVFLDADNLEPFLIFMGISSIAALEIIIRKWKHYRSGVDDVLLHSGIICLLAFFSMKFETAWELAFSAIAVLLYSITSLRYLDRLSAILAPLALAGLVYYGTIQARVQPSILVLIVISIFMAVTAMVAQRLQKKPQYIFQSQVLQVVKYTAVIACYGCLHYYIGAQYFYGNNTAVAGLPVFQVWMLWIWTIVIPPGILYYGLVKKRRPWIRIGIALTLLIFYYWQYEFHPIEHELAALLYGILLAVLSYLVINYLKTNASAFTDDPVQGEPDWPWSVTIAAVAGSSPAGFHPAGGVSPEGHGTAFGGGNFGGGGAGSEF